MNTRVAIVGTAPSWVKTPFDDPTLDIFSLNDAYMSKGPNGERFTRADAWFEQHPIKKMWFRDPKQRIVHAADIPAGAYVRPKGHLEWLKAQAKTIPVYLQDEPPADWPANAKRFPLEQVEAEFGAYWASGPSYMVALAIQMGYREIHVYGIHLATEQEYIDQRPNFEHFLGIARGRGITVVMADESPVMKHRWRYAYEPRPEKPVNAAAVDAQRLHSQRAQLLKQLALWPRWKSKAAALDRLRRLTAQENDARLRMQRIAIGGSTVRAAA